MPAYAHLFWISQFKNICFKKLFKILSMQCWHLLWKCFHLDTVQTKQHSTLNGSPVYFLIYAIIQATRILLYGSIIISQQCNTQNHRHCSKVSGCGKCVLTNFAIVVCTNWSEQQSLQIMVQAKKIKIIANTVSGNALFFPKAFPNLIMLCLCYHSLPSRWQLPTREGTDYHLLPLRHMKTANCIFS